MKLLLLLPFLPGLLIAQQAQSGTDIYLNSKANFICQQIEQSETAIEDMHSRQASMLTIKKTVQSTGMVEEMSKGNSFPYDYFNPSVECFVFWRVVGCYGLVFSVAA